ncbi:MAG: hypothetical protein R8K48_05115 [Gallionella sp.]
MAATKQFVLVPDSKGMVWDLTLYIPTIIALASISASLWYSNDHTTSYVFFFLTCFFSIAGYKRVFDTRLMLFASSPMRLEVGDDGLTVISNNGNQVALRTTLKYFPDYGGKSFAISGQDEITKQHQYIFHRGRFESPDRFKVAQEAIKNRIK